MEQQLEITPQELRRRLDLLQSELAVAATTGLSQDSAYMLDLHQELAEIRGAWVLACVTAKALLRTERNGPLRG